MIGRHISEDRLIALSVGGTWPRGAEVHLATCEECRARRDSLTAVLDEFHDAAVIEADAAFPAERLARQHARILQRLAAAGRPGRVIAFPASLGTSQRTMSWRPTTRWIAAAALAGLFVGVLADHVFTRLPGSATGNERPQEVVAAPRPTIQPVAVSLSDDEFLGELEAAVQGRGPVMLRALDAMTPLAWEVSP